MVESSPKALQQFTTFKFIVAVYTINFRVRFFSTLPISFNPKAFLYQNFKDIELIMQESASHLRNYFSAYGIFTFLYCTIMPCLFIAEELLFIYLHLQAFSKHFMQLYALVKKPQGSKLLLKLLIQTNHRLVKNQIPTKIVQKPCNNGNIFELCSATSKTESCIRLC